MVLLGLDPCVCVCMIECVCVHVHVLGTTYFIGKVITLCLLLVNVFAGILSLDDQTANSMEAVTPMWNSCSFQFRVPSHVPLATWREVNTDGERDDTHANMHANLYSHHCEASHRVSACTEGEGSDRATKHSNPLCPNQLVMAKSV